MRSTELRERDLWRALALLERVGTAPSVFSFHEEALAGLRELVGCDVGLIGFCDPVERRGGGGAEDPVGTMTAEIATAWDRHMPQEPIVMHQIGRPTPHALKISDFLSLRAWLRTDLYNEAHRFFGGRHNLALRLDTPGRREFTCLSLFRAGRDFSERERQLLTVLRPHLCAAQHRAGLREAHDPATNGNGSTPYATGNGANGSGLDAARLSGAGLSRRELEVLRLVSRGLINDAIAIELGISPRTVQKHLERVHRKLGVGTRMAAVARAHELSHPRG